jgi:hypothetical protein
MTDVELSFTDLLTHPENLHWAWMKFRRNMRYGNVLYDEIELSNFEANLKNELKQITKQFQKLTYRLSPIKPMPHPKKPDENGDSQTRQMFYISVRDQVAWIAFVNIIGPWFDTKMPVWSYGNRLYRSVWIEDDEDKHLIKMGFFRHSSQNIYRKFKQSWPVFRRHIFLTAKTMSKTLTVEELDEPDARVFNAEKSLPRPHQLPYLQSGYWKIKSDQNSLYWAGIDLKKFYPNINLNTLKKNLGQYSDHFNKDIQKLANTLLKFPLDLTGYNRKELAGLGLTPKQKIFQGVPTGLAVSGFLANVALLEIDQEVSKELMGENGIAKKPIAHFRYVDDHVFLSNNFEELVAWIKYYENLLEEKQLGASIGAEKTEPKEFRDFLGCNSKEKKYTDLKNGAKKACKIDPQYPSPLMTKTLGLVSNLANVEFDLLHAKERKNFLDGLEHLLLTEFPNTEIREDTRMSFAATRLSWYGPRVVSENSSNLCHFERQIAKLTTEKEKSQKRIKALKKNTDEKNTLEENLSKTEDQLAIVRIRRRMRIAENEAESAKHRKRIFYLLMKAINEHPDKLVLWTRMLQFCQYSGHDGFATIHETFEDSCENSPLSAIYLSSFLRQYIARQIVKCTLVIADIKQSDVVRKYALKYMMAALKHPIKHDHKGKKKFFEQNSIDLFECAVGSALYILNNVKTDRILRKDTLKKINNHSLELQKTSWMKNVQTWADTTTYPLPIWTWWIDSVTSRSKEVPSLIWESMASKLDHSKKLAWHVTAKYPAYTLKQIKNSMFQKDNLAGKTYYTNKAWLYALLSGENKRKLNRLKKSTDLIKIKQVISLINENESSFDKWSDWLTQNNKKQSFDPRASEWTALNLVDKLLERIITSSNIEYYYNYPFHPANFFVPKEWKEIPNQGLSWEKWSGIIKSGDIQIRKGNKIFDPHYKIYTEKHQKINKEFGVIRGIGLLLVGLITQSYNWPIPWHKGGYGSDDAAFYYLRSKEVPVSSWTMAILETTLLSRPYETFFLELAYQPTSDDDTTLDPPKISTIIQLKDCIKKSITVLAQNQITVQDHMPRQLIPVKIQQLTRPNWTDDFEMEGIQ